MTLKNYNAKEGVATRISNQNLRDPITYKIRGPLGKGLDLRPTGLHIAFTGGSGVLAFLDLVAYMVRANLGQTAAALDPAFKFILYVSFPSLKDSIARGLCLGLKNLCRTLNLSNFDYIERISNSGALPTDDTNTTLVEEAVKPKQWDEKFIGETLNSYRAQGLAKVWVCGPPRMNEEFESVLKRRANEFNLHPLADIEIM